MLDNFIVQWTLILADYVDSPSVAKSDSVITYGLLHALLVPCVSQDFRLLIDDDSPELLLKLRDLIIPWVQEGFQGFFRKLHDYFFLLSGKRNTAGPNVVLIEEMPGDKISAGLVLVLAELTVFIEQSAIPRINEASCIIFFAVLYLDQLAGLGLHMTFLVKISGTSFFFWWRHSWL